MHSKTIANAPAFSIFLLGQLIEFVVLTFLPSTLNFFLNCGVNPICPITLIPEL